MVFDHPFHFQRLPLRPRGRHGLAERLFRLPAAVVVVAIEHEHIAIAEAKRLGSRTLAMVDTNSDPGYIDFPVPANDDASKSVSIITRYLTDAIR